MEEDDYVTFTMQQCASLRRMLARGLDLARNGRCGEATSSTADLPQAARSDVARGSVGRTSNAAVLPPVQDTQSSEMQSQASKPGIYHANRASVKIQASARGYFVRKVMERQGNMAKVLQRAVRRKQSDKHSLAAVVLMARRKFPTWAPYFEACCESGRSMDANQFESALRQAHSSISSAQAIALWSGVTENTHSAKLEMDLNTFCSIAEALENGDQYAAEFAEMSTDAFRRLGTGNAEASGAEACGALVDEDASTARSRELHPDWAAIFEESRGGKPGLDQSGFSKAISRSVPEVLSAAQVQAVWNGYYGAVDKTVMSLADFCDIAEAVQSTEEDRMAEFANVSIKQFQELGTTVN